MFLFVDRPNSPTLNASEKSRMLAGALICSASTGRVIWLRGNPEIWLERFPAFRKAFFRLVIRKRGNDDHVIARDPIRRRRHLVPVGKLETIDRAQYLGEVAPSRCGVGQGQAHFFLWVDDEDRSDRESVTGIWVEHSIELCYRAIRVGDQREVQRSSLGLANIANPASVILKRIDRQPYDLDAAPVKLGLKLGNRAQLCRANRCKILRVGK